MKKLSRLVTLGVAAVAALALATPTFAGCPQFVNFGQVDPNDFTIPTAPVYVGYHYVQLPLDSATDNTSIIGRYWETGLPANQSGANDDSAWLVPYATATQFYINGDLQLGPGGCPEAPLMLVLETVGTGPKAGQAFAAVSRVDKTPGGAAQYNYNRVNGGADIVLGAIPAPLVTGRVGTTVNLSIAHPAAGIFFSAGPGEPNPGTAITGYQIVRKNATTAADDSRTAGWTATGTTISSAGGTGAVTVDCGTVVGQDVLLATRLLYSDGQSSNYVSQSSVVKCSGNLAEPKDFKLIDKQPKARGPKSK